MQSSVSESLLLSVSVLSFFVACIKYHTYLRRCHANVKDKLHIQISQKTNSKTSPVFAAFRYCWHSSSRSAEVMPGALEIGTRRNTSVRNNSQNPPSVVVVNDPPMHPPWNSRRIEIATSLGGGTCRRSNAPRGSTPRPFRRGTGFRIDTLHRTTWGSRSCAPDPLGSERHAAGRSGLEAMMGQRTEQRTAGQLWYLA